MNKVITSLKVKEDNLEIANNALKLHYPNIKELALDLGLAQGTAYNFFNGKPVRISIFKEIAESINLPWDYLSGYQKCSRIMSPHWSLFEGNFQELISNVLDYGNYIVIVGHYPISYITHNTVIFNKLVAKNCQILIMTQDDRCFYDIDFIASLIGQNSSKVRTDCEQINLRIKNTIDQIKPIGYHKFDIEKKSLSSLSWHGIFSCVKQNGKVRITPDGFSAVINFKDSFSLNECLIQPICNKSLIDNQSELLKAI